jgi:hypothetical protein
MPCTLTGTHVDVPFYIDPAIVFIVRMTIRLVCAGRWNWLEDSDRHDLEQLVRGRPRKGARYSGGFEAVYIPAVVALSSENWQQR